MKSPLDPNNISLELVEEIDVDKIVFLYKKLGMDVERFFNTNSVSILKCTTTGYRFYFPFEIIGDADFYAELSKNRANYYSERWEHLVALKFLKENDQVLEIGSGFGHFLTLLEEKGIQGKGLELNPEAIKECKKKNLKVVGELVENEAFQNENFYDAVVSFQVLEHIADVHSFISSSTKTLRKGGKLIIGVPNNNPYLFINDKYHTLNLPPHHAGLWDEKSLKSIENIFSLKLEKLIFEPLDITYDYFIEVQMQNAPSKSIRKGLKLLNRNAPKLLKLLCCKFIKGRNVLAVYTKTEE